jgi:hypothetical protein
LSLQTPSESKENNFDTIFLPLGFTGKSIICTVKIRRTAEASGYEETKFLTSSLIAVAGNLN